MRCLFLVLAPLAMQKENRFVDAGCLSCPQATLETNMKKLILAAALTVAASTAFAGSPADPIVEPIVVENDASGSSGGIILPLLILIAVAAAVSD